MTLIDTNSVLSSWKYGDKLTKKHDLDFKIIRQGRWLAVDLTSLAKYAIPPKIMIGFLDVVFKVTKKWNKLLNEFFS